MFILRLTASSVAISVMMLSASALHAQEVRGPEGVAAPSAAPAAAAPEQAASPSSGGLEDIVVTARKVAENQQKVPVAVTAYSGAALQQQSAVRIPDIARLTPGLTMSPASSTATAVALEVRGQVQTDVLATLDPSVGTYVDGFYWARAYGLNADLLDVQSAQVLRGPQGTLFGRNTTGGALLLQTNDPSYQGISGLVSGTYGRFNERSGTAVLNVPLVEDKLAVRGAFTINKRDGNFRDTNNDQRLGNRNSYTGRVKLLANPTENLSILLSGEWFRTNALTRPYQLAYVSPASAANLEAAFEVYGVGSPADRQGQGIALLNSAVANTQGTDTAALNKDPRSYAKTQTYTATATVDTFFGAIKFIGGYRKVQANANIDLDGSTYQLVRTLGQQDLEQYSGEVQITGKAFNDKLDFAGGVFAFHEDGSDQSTSIALPVLTRAFSGGLLARQIYFGDITTRSMGIYGQATYHLTDRFSIVGGLRYSVEDKNIVSFNRTVNDATGAFLACSIVGADPATCRIERKNQFEGVSYTAGVNYQLAPEVLLYAKTSKGFRSGGQNLRAAGAANSAFVPFQPEVAREEEVGVKAELFDRRVRFNLAAFYNEVSNIQRTTLVTSVDPVTGATATSTIVGNAGKARFYGGEAELTAQLFRGFTAIANGALTDAKYLSYIDPNSGADRSGEAFALVPKWTFSVAGNYEHELGIGALLLHLDYAWQGRTALYNTDAATDAVTAAISAAVIRRPGGEMNARASLSVLDKKLELAVFGRNILNRRFNTTALSFGTTLGVVSTQRNDPATYGVTATYRFGS
jgi:iron complex outermembrane recepter protein